MPGHSLWLLPPPTSPLHTTLQTLITTTIPHLFPSRTTHSIFPPHVTITSEIPADLLGSNPQSWLENSLDLSSYSKSNPVVVRLEEPEPGDPFFKKLTVRVSKDEDLLRLARDCRCVGVLKGDVERATQWAGTEYLPHLSLMYADMPATEVRSKMKEIQEEYETAIRKLKGQAKDESFRSGRIVLFDTTGLIEDWKEVAGVELENLHWTWASL